MRLIDADALFDWGKHKLSDAVKYGNKDKDQQRFSYSTLMMYEIADEIDDAPTIDAVPVVRGEWKKDGEYPWLLNCSGCGYSTEHGTNYCPDCGAKADDNHDQPYAAGNK
jgi:rubrerythrin